MAFKKAAVITVGILLPFANTLTVEGMLAAPRRSTANVNPSGKWALFTSTSYDWESQKSSTTWHLLDVASGETKEAPFGSDVSEVVWIGDTDTGILYINSTNEDTAGGVTLYTADLGAKKFSPTLAASLEAPFQGLKAVQTKSGDINFVVNALTHWEDGSAYNPELAVPPLSSGAIYDSNYIRHWDTYITSQRYAIFSGKLTLSKGGNKYYSLEGDLKNLLLGINATVTRPETPVQPFGDQGDYDLSPNGETVAFLTKAPELSKANHTASYIYLVPHDGSKVAVSVNGPNTSAPEKARGASGSPRWSPDGRKLAYIQQDGISYESDRYKLYIAAVEGLDSKISPLVEDWGSSPSSLQWTPDGKNLCVASELYASVRLFTIPYNAESSFVPKNFTGPDTNLADFAVLADGRALVSASASWTSRIFYTQSPGKDRKILFTANEIDPELKGLEPDSVANFWVENDDGDKIQTFMFYPTDFNPQKKYPLAFIIHGGPQSTQGDSWSTRWNLRLWAEQGFIVTATQFTGSPSYGQAFTDKIQNNWGGTPYTDLVKVFAYLKHNVSYVDTDRAIAAGASFGCYMTNWIQGHDLGREFKALVCHDGKVNQVAAYATDELWFIEHDSNGTIWNDRDNYELWDPLAHAANFNTPEFIVHSDGDY